MLARDLQGFYNRSGSCREGEAERTPRASAVPHLPQALPTYEFSEVQTPEYTFTSDLCFRSSYRFARFSSFRRLGLFVELEHVGVDLSCWLGVGVSRLGAENSLARG